MRKRTHDEFVHLVGELGNGEYEVLGRYLDSHTKIKMKHLTCGFEWEQAPTSFISGKRCLNCGYAAMRKAQRKTNEQFRDEVFNLVGGDYTFKDKYLNNTTKLRVVHNVCGHEYSVIPRDFLQDRRCPKCKGSRISQSARHDPSKFRKEFEELVDGEYTLLTDYKKAISKVVIKHNKCGKIYKVAPVKFLGGNRCPDCVFKEMGEKQRLTQEEFIDRVNHSSLGEIEILGKYQGNRTKVKFRHSKCGTEWEAVPDAIFRGSGCPFCKASIGEKTIERFLIETNIPYERQFKIEGCRNQFPLPFDFAIFNNHRQLLFLVEYDGIQHFEPVDYFGGIEALERTQFNDRIKKNFCKRNGIPLIIIPYNEDMEKYKTIIFETYANLEPSTQEIV